MTAMHVLDRMMEDQEMSDARDQEMSDARA